jgi:hypothetical protein
MARALRDIDSRDAARRSVRLVAAAFWPDGSSASVLISNLSYSGCEMQSRHSFEAGGTIRLTLPDRGNIHGHIRWVRNGRAGIKFLTGGDSARDIRRARIGV